MTDNIIGSLFLQCLTVPSRAVTLLITASTAINVDFFAHPMGASAVRRVRGAA